jgi:hypothetical protein
MTTPDNLRELPSGGYLTYSVAAEAYYYHTVGREEPSITVMSSHTGRGGGVSWEFQVVDRSERIGQLALRVEIFDDAWAAFVEVPEIFAAMAAGTVKSLNDLRTLLDGLGAVDETTREQER